MPVNQASVRLMGRGKSSSCPGSLAHFQESTTASFGATNIHSAARGAGYDNIDLKATSAKGITESWPRSDQPSSWAGVKVHDNVGLSQNWGITLSWLVSFVSLFNPSTIF